MFSARNDRRQMRHHLAAIAHAQREAVGAIKKCDKRVAQCRIKQDRLRPALPRAQHVTVGKTAARRQPLEVRQPHPTALQIGHVHIKRRKAGTLESGRHFHMTIHPLLAQDRHFRPCCTDDRWGNRCSRSKTP